MTNIEKLDKAFEELEKKYKKPSALENIEEFLKTGNKMLITSTNGARSLAKQLSYVDIFEILSKYALLSFIRNNKQVTMTAEEVNKNVNDLEGKIHFTPSSAVETLVLINAINPFYGYPSIACSKNLKNMVIKSLVFERYENNIKDDFNQNVAKFLTIMENKQPKKMITSIERIERCVNVIKEEEQENYEMIK